ncbi:hypothetical protein OHV05_21720 [Kitasatospora sp. NBC_00070]|uniref:hypothetical protein n=1 Tax=Kitasatospora sp. NBC_00070 TaxID=2975962 RepID=UPI003247DFCE
MSDGAGMNNGGYGPPPGQGQSSYPQYPGYGPPPTEPNWEQLAEQAAGEQRRKTRNRILLGVGALLVVGALTAVAVTVSRSGKDDPIALPSQSASPKASGPAKPSASAGEDESTKAIWDVTTDKAPVTSTAFFPEDSLTINGHTWVRRAVATTTPCWNATIGGLGDVIAGQACQQVFRATYASGDSAIVVGVAVFDKKLQAETAMTKYKGHIKGLPADDVKEFCQTVGCASTHGSLGRFAYFTSAGSAKAGGTTADQTATDSGPAFADHLRELLTQRALSQPHS